MIKGKDFYGQDISEVIDQACRALGASREELDIEVLEAGSAGIFGLCKKKAHIRVQRKQGEPEERTENPAPVASPQDEEITAPSIATIPPTAAALPAPSRSRRPVKSASGDQHAGTNENSKEMTEAVVEEIDTNEEEQPLTPPSEEDLKLGKSFLSRNVGVSNERVLSVLFLFFDEFFTILLHALPSLFPPPLLPVGVFVLLAPI